MLSCSCVQSLAPCTSNSRVVLFGFSRTSDAYWILQNKLQTASANLTQVLQQHKCTFRHIQTLSCTILISSEEFKGYGIPGYGFQPRRGEVGAGTRHDTGILQQSRMGLTWRSGWLPGPMSVQQRSLPFNVILEDPNQEQSISVDVNNPRVYVTRNPLEDPLWIGAIDIDPLSIVRKPLLVGSVSKVNLIDATWVRAEIFEVERLETMLSQSITRSVKMQKPLRRTVCRPQYWSQWDSMALCQLASDRLICRGHHC